eukprot:4174630-Amphidinium_carterae.1
MQAISNLRKSIKLCALVVAELLSFTAKEVCKMPPSRLICIRRSLGNLHVAITFDAVPVVVKSATPQLWMLRSSTELIPAKRSSTRTPPLRPPPLLPRLGYLLLNLTVLVAGKLARGSATRGPLLAIHIHHTSAKMWPEQHRQMRGRQWKQARPQDSAVR